MNAAERAEPSGANVDDATSWESFYQSYRKPG